MGTVFKQRFTRLRSSRGHWLVDPELRSKLIDDAEREGTSMTSVVVRILSESYKVPFEPSTRSGKPSDDNDVIVLMLPVALDRKVAMSAGAHSRTVQEEIRVALSAHYGLAVPEPVPVERAPRKRAAA